MEIRGRVHNGVVILEGGQSLPEGTIVTVSYPDPPPTTTPESGHKVQLPLVRSDRPGSLELTPDRIAELWEEDDLASFGGFDESGPRPRETED